MIYAVPPHWRRKSDRVEIDFDALLEAAIQAGMKIGEFWDATVRDVLIVLRASQKAQEAEWERVAWQTALLMNIHLQRRHQVTARKLLGRPATASINNSSVEDKHAELQRRRRREKAIEIWGHPDGHALNDDEE